MATQKKYIRVSEDEMKNKKQTMQNKNATTQGGKATNDHNKKTGGEIKRKTQDQHSTATNEKRRKAQQEEQDGEFSTNWDIDAYRTDHESEEHWALRRRFMEAYKDRFPEDKLVCLAQVFVNMEFMGCKYPSETMRLVSELAKDVAKEYREDRTSKLKRTFVTASDAAEARAKGRRSTQQQQQPSQPQQERTSSNFNARGQNMGQRQRFGTGKWEPKTQTHIPFEANTRDFFSGLPYGQFVLYLAGGRQALVSSASRSKMTIVEKETKRSDGCRGIELLLNGKCVASAFEYNIKTSKAEAFRKAVELFQKCCYSIKPNPLRDTIKVEKNGNKVVCGITKQQADTTETKKLDETNVGYKMMKMMGWTGGGLGAQQQGREDPVDYLFKNNRSGFGTESGDLNRQYLSQMLENFIASDDIRDLQFEPTFTKDERSILHEIAGRFNLKSSSYGKDEARRLVISKKISNERILHEVLINKNEQYRNKFIVQVPESMFSQYPEHTAQLTLDT